MHARASAFSYRCRACSRCCYGKRIQVNPYELARLARGLDTTTTDVIARFTVDGGTALAVRGDRACVFLGPDGCTVHADRPLVCRLYPLGRIVQADGSETFVEHEPHPETDGVYGEDGTVGEYVDTQGVAPYIAASDRYFAVLTRLMRNGGVQNAQARDDDRSTTAASSGAADTPDIDTRAFIDADVAVQLDAARGTAAVFADADALMERHLVLIEGWAEQLTDPGIGRSSGRPTDSA
jgi:hypothetical protein